MRGFFFTMFPESMFDISGYPLLRAMNHPESCEALQREAG
jgi:hypothetical protein